MWRKTALWQCLYEHVLPSRVQPSLSRARVLSPSTPGSPRRWAFRLTEDAPPQLPAPRLISEEPPQPCACGEVLGGGVGDRET